jgi:hypothetical protein
VTAGRVETVAVSFVDHGVSPAHAAARYEEKMAKQTDNASGLWPATNGRIPETPSEIVRHLDYMAARGRALRAAQAGQRRRRLLAQAADSGDGQRVCQSLAVPER